jgi:porphobilinogen deaminase
LNHDETARLVAAERKVLNLFEGGCQLPLGAYCVAMLHGVRLHATMAGGLGQEPRAVVLDAAHTDGLAEEAVEGLKKKAFR